MKTNNLLIAKIKKEFLNALENDVEFRGSIQKKLEISTNCPFVRNREMERIKIEEAINEINFKTISAIATVKSALDGGETEGCIYFSEEKCKENIRRQLKRAFDCLFTDFPNVTTHHNKIGGESYSLDIDGAFYTSAEYYKLDDGTWEPSVSVRFCPIEYIEY